MRSVLPRDGGELAGFAELVAETALSFLDESENGSARTLLEQIVAGAVLVIPGTAAAAVESLDRDGRLHAPVAEGDDVARSVMEAQNDTGQGPCLDAVASNRPVVAVDLDAPDERRWPALAEAVLGYGIRAVYALPVTIASIPIGALDLFCRSSGPMSETALTGGLWAAGLAALPVLDLMNSNIDWQAAGDAEECWEQLASLERVEVYQATGFLIDAFHITAADAVARLRAHAISHGLTASEVAYRILQRRIVAVDGELKTTDDGGADK